MKGCKSHSPLFCPYITVKAFYYFSLYKLSADYICLLSKGGARLIEMRTPFPWKQHGIKRFPSYSLSLFLQVAHLTSSSSLDDPHYY